MDQDQCESKVHALQSILYFYMCCSNSEKNLMKNISSNEMRQFLYYHFSELEQYVLFYIICLDLRIHHCFPQECSLEIKLKEYRSFWFLCILVLRTFLVLRLEPHFIVFLLDLRGEKTDNDLFSFLILSFSFKEF